MHSVVRGHSRPFGCGWVYHCCWFCSLEDTGLQYGERIETCRCLGVDFCCRTLAVRRPAQSVGDSREQNPPTQRTSTGDPTNGQLHTYLVVRGSTKPTQLTRPVCPVRTALLTTKAQHNTVTNNLEIKLTPLWWDGLAFWARFWVELPAICLGTGAMVETGLFGQQRPELERNSYCTPKPSQP